jgi:hypothetical protein
VNRSLSLGLLAITLTSFAVACSKTDPPAGGGAPPATSSAALTSASAPSPTPSSSAAGAGSAAPSSAGAKAGAGAFSGDYQSAVTDLAVPEGVKWKGDAPADEGVGKGTLSLSVDEAGIVTGSGTGALGDVILSGISRDGLVSGLVLRKSSADGGYTGTFYATEEQGELKGTIRVSKGNAGGLREAKFSLAKAKK